MSSGFLNKFDSGDNHYHHNINLITERLDYKGIEFLFTTKHLQKVYLICLSKTELRDIIELLL